MFEYPQSNCPGKLVTKEPYIYGVNCLGNCDHNEKHMTLLVKIQFFFLKYRNRKINTIMKIEYLHFVVSAGTKKH